MESDSENKTTKANTTVCRNLMYFWLKNIRTLSVEFFIAKRILPNRSQGIKVSRPILRIAVISISLSIVVNLLTFAVVTGFKNEIRRKVTGFSAPIFLQNINNADFYESDPIQRSEQIETILSNHPGILDYSAAAYKPGMLQSPYGNHDVFGVVFKGIDGSFDPSFLKEHLVEGLIPDFNTPTESDALVLSSKICQQLNLKLNDEISALFVKNEPFTRKFKVVGIYNTGFDDCDNKLVLCDIKIVQKLNDWGISGQLDLADSLVNGQMPVMLNLQGNTEQVAFDWGRGPDIYRGQVISTNVKDTILQVKVLSMVQGTLTPIDTHRIRITYVREVMSENEECYKEAINFHYGVFLFR